VSPVAIEARGLGVRFLFDRLSRQVTPTIARLRFGVTEKWGLREVGFSIRPGQGVALIGPSGSGKTTLLRVMAGVLEPDTGSLEVRGRVGSLLSIDAGLMGLLTGRENSELLGVLAGLSRQDARAALPRVAERIDLEEAFDRPVGSYSQGMRARLGFAVAEEADPRILLLDEVHEALDHEFREIVEAKARSILEEGGIVMAAGHDHPLLERLCDRAILLRRGEVVADGAFESVRTTYLGDRA
jgi:ABC-type polysaccharide/polyol phosphate transport system ATPase subunit